MGALDPSIWEDSECVSPEEVQSLTVPFTEEEIKYVVFSMEADHAPGPDGLSMRFYQEFWDLVKIWFNSNIQCFFQKYSSGWENQ